MPKAALKPREPELDPKLQKELLKHAGRWVATTRDKLLAVGDSAQEVYREARDQGVEIPIVYRVPEAGSSYLL